VRRWLVTVCALAACRSAMIQHQRGISGALLVTDVATGEIVRVEGDIDARVLPRDPFVIDEDRDERVRLAEIFISSTIH